MTLPDLSDDHFLMETSGSCHDYEWFCGWRSCSPLSTELSEPSESLLWHSQCYKPNVPLFVSKDFKLVSQCQSANFVFLGVFVPREIRCHGINYALESRVLMITGLTHTFWKINSPTYISNFLLVLSSLPEYSWMLSFKFFCIFFNKPHFLTFFVQETNYTKIHS